MNSKFFQLKKFIKSLYNIPAIPKKRNLQVLYKEDLFVLVDVGATGGMDGNWVEIKDFCHYITFDPDPRARIINCYAKHTNYNIGLWSKKGTPTLYLTKLPDASSIYQHNLEVLSAYLNNWCHQIVDHSKITVDTLDNTLKTSADFIKVDAEGADLEILKGSKKSLFDSCLGIEVEVSFINRHKNAPYFAETDSYLREHDFLLMDIQVEKWIRNNNTFSSISNAQLIWGNAIYVLSKESLLKRIQNLPQSQKDIIFIKYITILLIYRFHDYAIEICDYFNNKNTTENKQITEISDYFINKKFISENYIKSARELIQISLPSRFVHLFKLIISLLFSIILICIFFLSSKHRAKAILFFKARLVDFAKFISKTMRFGPNNCCIYG